MFTYCQKVTPDTAELIAERYYVVGWGLLRNHFVNNVIVSITFVWPKLEDPVYPTLDDLPNQAHTR